MIEYNEEKRLSYQEILDKVYAWENLNYTS